MAKIILPQKFQGETLQQQFDFSSLLVASGISISSAVAACAVYSGTDASPGLLITGSPTIAGLVVTQPIAAGVVGVTYLITVTATASNGAIVSLQGYLTVMSGLV